MAEQNITVTTTRELAELAGVSHMTVSRVFKQPEKVRAETRERILALAEECGFRPNPVLSMAMAIRNQKRAPDQAPTSTMAFVHSNSRIDTWHSEAHLSPYLQGIRERAKLLGFGLDEFWLNPKGLSQKRFCDILDARGIHGCVVAPPRGQLQRLRLRWGDRTWVTFHHDSWRPLLHRVAKDENYMMGKSLRELRRLGYSKVGLAIPRSLDQSGGFIMQGRFRVAQERHPETGKVPPLFYAGADIPEAKSEIAAWLKRYKPDVLVCADVRAMALLNELGLRVPEDIGLLHLNLGLDTPGWSGMYLDGSRIGAATVDLIVSQIQQNQRGIPEQPYELLLRPQWRRGETL